MTERSNEKDDILNIYISFDKLTATDIAFYLQRLSNIADKLIEDYFIIEGKSFNTDELPKLEIESMHTGNSIDFNLKEGKKFELGADENHDFVIRAPKKIGTPIMIAWLLLTGYQNILDIQVKHGELRKNEIENLRSKANDSLETEIKKKDLAIKNLELKLKERDYAKVLADDSGNLKIERIYDISPELKTLTMDTIKEIAKNNRFKDFKVNGLSIKINPSDNEK